MIRFLGSAPRDYFPDDEFFPDLHDLLDDMTGEDTDPKSSASAAAVPYVFLSFLLKVLPQFLVLVLVLHMICSTSYMQLVLLSAIDMLGYGSYMQKLFTFSLSEHMTCFYLYYITHALSSISVNKIIW